MSWTITPAYRGAAVSDPDAQTYLRAVDAADGQALEQGVQKAVNQFVIGCKADGIWTAIKASCILAGARTLSGALVPLTGTAPTNFNFVSGDYNRKTGLVGNGSNKYLNSNRNNNADPQDSQHLSVYISQAASSSASFYPAYIGGGSSFSGSSVIGRLNNNGNLYIRSRSQSFSTDITGSATGFIGSSRGNSASHTIRGNATTTTVTRTSQLPRNVLIYVGLDADSTSDSISNARTAFYSIGESLNLALLDSRVTALVTAFATAIP